MGPVKKRYIGTSSKQAIKTLQGNTVEYLGAVANADLRTFQQHHLLRYLRTVKIFGHVIFESFAKWPAGIDQ